MAIGQQRPKRLNPHFLRKLDHVRKEYWRNYRPRAEIAGYMEQMRANQARAEKVHELRRVEGYLSTMQPEFRVRYLKRAREDLWKSLKVGDSSGLL